MFQNPEGTWRIVKKDVSPLLRGEETRILYMSQPIKDYHEAHTVMRYLHYKEQQDFEANPQDVLNDDFIPVWDLEEVTIGPLEMPEKEEQDEGDSTGEV